MRILFCAYDRPGHIATGPNAWIQRLIFDLSKNYSLDIITLFFYTGKISECPTIDYFKSNNLKTESYCISKHQFIEDQVRYLLKVVQKNSITVVVANLTVPGYYAAQYLTPYHVACIPVFHSNDKFTKGVFNKFIVDKPKNYFTTTVAVSSYINKLSQSNGYVIPCGTPLIQNKAIVSNGNYKVIYAGRLVIEAKQIIKLTEAFVSASKQNEIIEFSIVGDGPWKDEVISILSKDDNHRVTLYDPISPNKIINKIAEHHTITLLSDYEGMPIAVMEAMSVGVVPVCYIGESGIAELIKDGYNGFIVKDREKDYQEKLNMLQQDPELWQRLSKNAIQTIEEKYSTKVTHQQWADLLNSFRNNEVKTIKIPKVIKLEGEPLLYGDNRKPSFVIRMKHRIEKLWMMLRLSIRPRARLKALFNK